MQFPEKEGSHVRKIQEVRKEQACVSREEKEGDEDPKIRIKSRWNPHGGRGPRTRPFNYDLYASDQDGNGMVVPCGKCMACRVKRTMEWSVRILDEASYYKTNTFLTLTYNDENLPKDGSLSKEEVQKYLKRLRERLDGREIKVLRGR